MEENVDEKISAIIKRNQQVEGDKAWETSWIRRILIALITYLTVLAFMLLYHFKNPFIGACIPVIGYVLSTLTLGIARKAFKR